MKQLLPLLLAVLVVGSLQGADEADQERQVTSAVNAADGLAGAADVDLEQLLFNTNRNFLASTTEIGGTVRARHSAMRQEAERLVLEMGEVKGKYAEAALLIRELWHTADAEMDLVMGDEPIDGDFEQKAAEHRARVAQLRAKLKPMLPDGVHLLEPFIRK